VTFAARDARSVCGRNPESPLRDQTKGMRSKTRPPWWKFAPPHAERYWATPLEDEKPTVKVDDVAATLRTTPSAIRPARGSWRGDCWAGKRPGRRGPEAAGWRERRRCPRRLRTKSALNDHPEEGPRRVSQTRSWRMSGNLTAPPDAEPFVLEELRIRSWARGRRAC